MASQAIQAHRDNAEVYHGNSPCIKNIEQLLDELSLPKGLFPLDDIKEFGYDRSSGFMWLTHKKKKDHVFKKIKQTVSYAMEVTAFVENRRMKKMSGVKTKELLLWLTITDVYIENPSSGKVTFKTGTGLSESFPTSAFELRVEAFELWKWWRFIYIWIGGWFCLSLMSL
ncbi:hypothetical protein QJS04_geneDACA018685 [Acorus gramineus]|uniref:Uncharacterized protein n=1 Tax=Acorus gramineus TaxID=55184 RepID=A0AAV9A427_ACOGR|nr:hypothetical protein QJS04_geneDACA018685 [Acorus gramineus]